MAFASSSNPSMRELARRYNANPNIAQDFVRLRRVERVGPINETNYWINNYLRDGKYGIVKTAGSISFYRHAVIPSENKCNLKIVIPEIYNRDVAFALFRKSDPLAEVFAKHLRLLEQFGIIEAIDQRENARFTHSPEKRNGLDESRKCDFKDSQALNEQISLSVKHFGYLFTRFFASFAFSVGVWLIEMFAHHYSSTPSSVATNDDDRPITVVKSSNRVSTLVVLGLLV